MFDVAVIGGGIAGMSAALLLKRDGARVAVLERGVACGGATGFTTAKVSALQETKLSEIHELHGADGAARVRGGEPGGGCANRRARARGGARLRLGARARLHVRGRRGPGRRRHAGGARRARRRARRPPDERGRRCRSPSLRPSACPTRASSIPCGYVRGLAAAVDGDGSRVFESTAVAGVEEGSPCRVHTHDGATVTARDVIVATNYPLLDRGLFFARMEAARSYLVAARVRGDAPDGMLITAGPPSRSLRSYRDGEDTWLLVGGEGHLTGSDEAQPARFEALERFAREHFDVVDVPYRWSTQDGMPTDKLPYIGPYTLASSHLFVAAGFQKWGMTSATIAAGVLADAIAGRENAYAAVFDPNRATVRSAPAVAKAQLWVARHFVGDRLRPAETRSAADVPAGEARVVRSGLGKTGVYRDADGVAHGVSLRCTHLGCLLHFNAAERSWDCPCHGSRFDVDGSVLAGPATAPLERRDVG